MSSALVKLSVKEALELLESKETSAVELTNAHISKMGKHKDLNCYITETYEIAINSAKASDERRSAGNNLALDGIPISIKDLFCTRNVRTTAASKMLENFIPEYNATVASNVLDKGAIMLGKTNMDEFAMGSTNMTSYFGPVISPWKEEGSDDDLVPGGSSGGSSASVAAFLAMASLGSDTGGSVRQPASFTGAVGVKPTYGRCSRFGMIAFASSLDQAGIITRSVDDAAIMLEHMMGFDPQDSTSVNIKSNKINLSGNIKNMKFGFPIDIYNQKGLNEEIKAEWDKSLKILENQGAQIVEITIPHAKYAVPIYYTIAPAEASSNLARYDGVRYGYRYEKEGISLDEMYKYTRTYGFGEEVKRRIMVGTSVLCSEFIDDYYVKAQKIRRLIYNDFVSAFNKVDNIILPSTPGPAFSIKNSPKNPVDIYFNDLFTIPANMAGLPAMSIPTGLSKKGLPLGMQIIGKAFEESIMLNTAKAIENAINTKFIPEGF